MLRKPKTCGAQTLNLTNDACVIVACHRCLCHRCLCLDRCSALDVTQSSRSSIGLAPEPLLPVSFFLGLELALQLVLLIDQAPDAVLQELLVDMLRVPHLVGAPPPRVEVQHLLTHVNDDLYHLGDLHPDLKREPEFLQHRDQDESTAATRAELHLLKIRKDLYHFVGRRPQRRTRRPVAPSADASDLGNTIEHVSSGVIHCCPCVLQAWAARVLHYSGLSQRGCRRPQKHQQFAPTY